MKARRILKIVLYPVLSVAVFVIFYLGIAWALARVPVQAEAGQAGEIAIYIKTNGVHTDIVVPAQSPEIDWTREIKFEHTLAADSTNSYLAFGWGDKGFYLETPTWADLKASVAFKAAFGLSNCAIHTTYYKQLKEGEDCRRIWISQAQYARLVRFIKASFQQDAAGHCIHIKTNANYGKEDAFYEGVGSYSLFHTCNTWANNALKSCGQKACLWTPFDTGIFLMYKD